SGSPGTSRGSSWPQFRASPLVPVPGCPKPSANTALERSDDHAAMRGLWGRPVPSSTDCGGMTFSLDQPWAPRVERYCRNGAAEPGRVYSETHAILSPVVEARGPAIASSPGSDEPAWIALGSPLSLSTGVTSS